MSSLSEWERKGGIEYLLLRRGETRKKEGQRGMKTRAAHSPCTRETTALPGDEEAGRCLRGQWRGGGSMVAFHRESSDSCVNSMQRERGEGGEAVGPCRQPEDKMRTNTRKHL